MSKEQSQLLKGIAILLMLFLHLFNGMNNVALCENFIYINGEPLVFILSRASNPVAFFLILGGYGLFRVSQHGDKRRWVRVLKLYFHYWLITVLFVFIGHFLSPAIYPGSWFVFVANLSSVVTSYNAQMWFLFPYVILSLVAPGFLLK